MDEVQMPARKDDMFNDELWDHQWYLHDTRYLTQDLPDISLHVENVWREGIAGNGIRVVVIDDGLDHSHPDLIQNYDKDIRQESNVTRSKIYRCDSDKAAMVAHDYVKQKSNMNEIMDS